MESTAVNTGIEPYTFFPMLFSPEQAVQWRENRLPTDQIPRARWLASHIFSNSGMKLLPDAPNWNKSYILYYTGPVLLQLGIPRSPIFLVVTLGEFNAYPCGVWLVNNNIRIGIEKRNADGALLLEYLDKDLGKQVINPKVDKFLGLFDGLIFPAEDKNNVNPLTDCTSNLS